MTLSVAESPATPEPLRSKHTASFPALLEQLGISVLVTTYQAGKLVLLRSDGTDSVNTHFRDLPRPMGLAAAVADNFLSLREAIDAVNVGSASGLSVAEQSQVTGTFGSSDTIQFDSSVTGTITLGGSELLLTADISITGPGASSLAVSGNNASRMFEVNAGVTASIARLTIRDGKAGYYNGGGIDNIFGTLTLTDSTVSGNTTIFGSGGIDNQDRRIQT